MIYPVTDLFNLAGLQTGGSWSSANLAEYMTIVGIYVHAFFLIFAVGFPTVVLTLESIGLIKKDNDYLKMAKNASKLWGITFAAGAVTGTLVEFGLVVVWSGSIALIASMAAAPLIIELYAFIIEIVLIGTYLTTFNRLKRWKGLHVLIGAGVLFGSSLSAYMILAVNAWMQVPWGTGTYVAQNFLPWVPSLGSQVINPAKLKILTTVLPVTGSVLLSSPNAFQLLSNFTSNPWVAIFNPEAYATYLHNLFAAIIITSFLSASYLSYKILKNYGNKAYNWKGLKVSFAIGAISSVIQPIIGDFQGRLLYEFQRNIFYATEGIPPNGGSDPLISFLLFGNAGHWFKGYNYLSSIPGATNPMAQLTIQSTEVYAPWLHFFYYFMVISGVILFVIAVGYLGLYSKTIDRIVRVILRMKTETFVLYSTYVAAVLAILASVFGWATREMGRHPWTIYGLVTYNDVVTTHTITVAFTVAIILLELGVLGAGLWGIYMIFFKNLRRSATGGGS
jgi:cytochrome d ubiquinol oxidase subunit I